MEFGLLPPFVYVPLAKSSNPVLGPSSSSLEVVPGVSTEVTASFSRDESERRRGSLWPHLPVDWELLLLFRLLLLLFGMLSGDTATISCPPLDTCTTTGLPARRWQVRAEGERTREGHTENGGMVLTGRSDDGDDLSGAGRQFEFEGSAGRRGGFGRRGAGSRSRSHSGLHG